MNSAAPPGIDAGRRRRQLPAELSGFVGRTDELAALAGLLRRGRLVTVTGPGGVGKTRLALRAAADAANRYADGTRLVELSGLADPALLPAAAARVPRAARARSPPVARSRPRSPAGQAAAADLRRLRASHHRRRPVHLAAAAGDQRDHDPGHQQAAAAPGGRAGPAARPAAGAGGRPRPGPGRRGRAVRDPRRRRGGRVHGLRGGAARRDQDLPAARRPAARARARGRPGAGAAAGGAGRSA